MKPLPLSQQLLSHGLKVRFMFRRRDSENLRFSSVSRRARDARPRCGRQVRPLASSEVTDCVWKQGQPAADQALGSKEWSRSGDASCSQVDGDGPEMERQRQLADHSFQRSLVEAF